MMLYSHPSASQYDRLQWFSVNMPQCTVPRSSVISICYSLQFVFVTKTWSSFHRQGAAYLRAICDFQRGAGRWASKSDLRWRTCCDKVEQKSRRGDIEAGWLW